MVTRRNREYPRVVYGPYGASMTIHGPGEWPNGWTARPDGGERERRQIDPSAPIPYKRAELKRRLRMTGVPFDENGSDADLWRRLQHYS